MATFDLVREAKGKPANFLNLGSEQTWYGSDEDPLERLRLGLEAVTDSSEVSVVLVNLIAGVTLCQDIATTLVELVHSSIALVNGLFASWGEMWRPLRKPSSRPTSPPLKVSMKPSLLLSKPYKLLTHAVHRRYERSNSWHCRTSGRHP